MLLSQQHSGAASVSISIHDQTLRTRIDVHRLRRCLRPDVYQKTYAAISDKKSDRARDLPRQERRAIVKATSARSGRMDRAASCLWKRRFVEIQGLE